jgi:dienelactone hydrolase
MRSLLLPLLLLLWTGCYRWQQVPVGVEQRVLDLSVSGLIQRYTVLSPQQSATQSQRRRPAMILLHSGFSGDERSTADLARTLAQHGLTVILPAYRGEVRKLDGKRSEGTIEFCEGEVDDAQAAFDWLSQQPAIDPLRIGVMGASHGGCIALRLGVRDPQLRVVVALSAPVAAAQLLRHLQAQPTRTFFYNGILASQLQSYLQGAPEQYPEAYAERSPLFTAGQLPMPLLIVHGTKDSIVPVEQACWLVQVLRDSGRTIHESRITPQGLRQEVQSSQCPPMPVQPVPPRREPQPVRNISARTELVLLQQQNHFYDAQIAAAARKVAIQFLLEELFR